MKNRIVFVIVMMLFLQHGQAQKQTWAEDFEGTLPSSGWSVVPQTIGSWIPNTMFYQSGTKSYHGLLPNQSGDSTILYTPSYNCTPYSQVFLRFRHICKISPLDQARLEYRRTGTSVWQVIPGSAYLGSAADYTNSSFNAANYSEWQAGDSTVSPNQSWWKDELFDLSAEAGSASVQFRFVIKRGNVQGTQISYGWLLDDFELIAASFQAFPPTTQFVAPLVKDTLYNVGPWEINALVKTNTNARIEPPRLNYTAIKNGVVIESDSILMTPVGDESLWKATIPKMMEGCNVYYSIAGRDSAGNQTIAMSNYTIAIPPDGADFGDVIIGTGTTVSDYGYGVYTHGWDYGWSRNYYRAEEIDPKRMGGFIDKIAFYQTATHLSNVDSVAFYFKATYNSVVAPDELYKDPILDGATLVWGSATASTGGLVGWVNFYLNTPFYLPSGMNLLVYCVHGFSACNPNVTALFRYTPQNTNTTIYGYNNGKFPAGQSPFSGGGEIEINGNRPNLRLSFVAERFVNHAAAMRSIDINDTVTVNATTITPIVVTVKNRGFSPLGSVKIAYKVNNSAVKDTLVLFSPALEWDFNAQVTLGNYIQRFNQRDTITAWVELPNNQYDSVTHDDTLIKVVYGSSDILVEFVSSQKDTVYYTGPYEVITKITSVNGNPINSPIQLFVTSTNTLTSEPSYDTLTMAPQGNNLWRTEIPNKQFETEVIYTFKITDNLGHIIEISGKYYIKERPVGSNGYVIVGTGTANSTYNQPMNTGFRNSWTRQLYLASEIDPDLAGGMITRLAWDYAASAPAFIRNHQRCYFQAVDDTVITVNTYMEPFAAGATLVWQGTYVSPAGRQWVEITLSEPFILPPGKNLLIYWEHADATAFAVQYAFNMTPMMTNMAVYASAHLGTVWLPANYNGTLTVNRPNARFLLENKPDIDYSVAMDAIVSPKEGGEAGVVTPIHVRIRNKGRNNLDSCLVYLRLNGVVQPAITYRHAGNGLLPDFTDTITLDYYTPSLGGSDEIVVWVSMPNNVADPVTRDDTLRVVSIGCSQSLMALPVLRIGAGGDFATITQLFNAIRDCGRTPGNLTLELKGTLNERVDLSNLSDFIGNYHLTIISVDNHADSAIIRPPAGSTYGIQLAFTDNITIKAITVDVSTMAIPAILFTNSCTNVLIRDCKLLCNLTTSSSASAPIYKAGTAQGVTHRISFINNLLDGGYYGAYFYAGTGSGAGLFGTNIVFDSNLVTNQYYYATNFGYADFTSCNYNTLLSRIASAYSYWYGISMTYCNGPIIGNRIIQRSNTIVNHWGIYPWYYNYYNFNSQRPRGLIANNEIILNTTGAYYGIYIGYANADIYHNSVYITGTGAARGINIAAAADLDIKNNNFVMLSATAHPLYFASAPVRLSMDYNNYYNPIGMVGYSGTNINTMSAWQQQFPSDLHSVQELPRFKDPTANLDMENPIDLLCPATTYVTNDIARTPRASRTIMGAYECPLSFDYVYFGAYDIYSTKDVGNTDLVIASNRVNSWSRHLFLSESMTYLDPAIDNSFTGIGFRLDTTSSTGDHRTQVRI